MDVDVKSILKLVNDVQKNVNVESTSQPLREVKRLVLDRSEIVEQLEQFGLPNSADFSLRIRRNYTLFPMVHTETFLESI